MSMKASGYFAVGAAAIIGLSSTFAKADSSTTIGLAASVADACSFGTVTDITFATQYQPGQTGTLGGSGSFVVNCTTSNQSITLTPDGGGNVGGVLGRQLVHETDASQLLTYQMSISDTDGAATITTFDVGAGYSPPTNLSSGDNTYLVEALIGDSQSVSGGAYSDTVGVTMSF